MLRPGRPHARHPPDPGPVPHHAPALPGARPGRAEAAHLHGPRGEHPSAFTRARHLQGLPRALLRERPPGAPLPLGDGHRPLRARLGRHLPLHPREPLREHRDPVREHHPGPRPRRPRDGAPQGGHPRVPHGAPLERPPAPRAGPGRPLRSEGRRDPRLRRPRGEAARARGEARGGDRRLERDRLPPGHPPHRAHGPRPRGEDPDRRRPDPRPRAVRRAPRRRPRPRRLLRGRGPQGLRAVRLVVPLRADRPSRRGPALHPVGRHGRLRDRGRGVLQEVPRPARGRHAEHRRRGGARRGPPLPRGGRDGGGAGPRAGRSWNERWTGSGSSTA